MKVSLTLIILLFSTVAFSARQSGKILGTGTEDIQITLSSPSSGWGKDRMVKVTGSVSDTTVNPVTIGINGDRYFIVTRSGNFSRSFPVTKGKNTISVIAKNTKGTFRKEKTYFAKINPMPLMAVLTSDTDGVYTDLHIYEPSPTNSSLQAMPREHVYWADTNSPTGGKFYLNKQEGSYDKPGYGPYLYTHQSPPLGIYKIDANYWPSGGKAHSQANLNLTLFGGTAKEQKRLIKYPLVKSGQTVTLAWVKIEKNSVGHIYVPIFDGEPNRKIWPEFVVQAK